MCAATQSLKMLCKCVCLQMNHMMLVLLVYVLMGCATCSPVQPMSPYSYEQHTAPGGQVLSFDPSKSMKQMLAGKVLENDELGNYGPLRGMLASEALDKPAQPSKQDTMNDMLSATLKKYRVKHYLLNKLLGASHEDDEGGFFSNTHLKRHGTAGVAAKVIGELIGIKIRQSIDNFGKSFSEVAKDYTTRNFVNMGNVFARFLKSRTN